MRLVWAAVSVGLFLASEVAGAILSQVTGLGGEITKMLLGGRSSLTWSELYSTYANVNTSIGLIAAVVVVVALYAVRHPGALTKSRRGWQQTLPGRINYPSLTGLVVAWVVAVFTMIGYPVAIYMTFRYATDRRAVTMPLSLGQPVPAAAKASPRAALAAAHSQKVRTSTTTSSADEIAGQGVVVLDRLFLAYLRSVMQRAWHKSDEEIRAVVRAHTAKLTDADPSRAWDYRMAVILEAAKTWPPDANNDFGVELSREWAPTTEDAERWAKLSERAKRSYIRQGQAMTSAVIAGMTAPASS